MCIQNSELSKALNSIQHELEKSQARDRGNDVLAKQLFGVSSELRKLSDTITLIGRQLASKDLLEKSAPIKKKRKGTPWSDERRAKYYEQQKAKKRSENISKSWTPERKAAQAERMRKLHEFKAKKDASV